MRDYESSRFPLESVHRIFACGKDLFELKGQGFLVFGFSQKLVEANITEFLFLVPELGGLATKT